MNEIIALLALCSPVIWELFNDRKGDVHPNNDWIIRGSLMLISSLVAHILTDRTFLQALVMSFGIFTLLFNYLYNLLNKKSPWYSYVSKTAIPDKWIGGIDWIYRLFIYLVIFGTCLSIYFWKEMMVWNYPYGH